MKSQQGCQERILVIIRDTQRSLWIFTHGFVYTQRRLDGSLSHWEQKLKAYLEILNGVMKGFNFYYTTPKNEFASGRAKVKSDDQGRAAALLLLVWWCCHGDRGAGCERCRILSRQQTQEINRKEAHMVSDVTTRLHTWLDSDTQASWASKV